MVIRELLSQRNASPVPIIVNEVNRLLQELVQLNQGNLPKLVQKEIKAVNRIIRKRGFRHRIGINWS
jgi:ribosomal protein S13